METKIKLNAGETLREDSTRSEGFLEETDVTEYSVIDQNGNVVGHVTHNVHTAVRGFNVTKHVTQIDNNGKIIVKESW